VIINWRYLTFVLLALAALAGGTTCDAKPMFESGPIDQVQAGKNYYRLTFQILSLSCPACAYGMEKEMSKLPGVKYVKIDLMKPNGALGEVIYDGNVTDKTAITNIVHEYHYSQAEVQQMPFSPNQI
jgi:copper chaperone CopZ